MPRGPIKLTAEAVREIRRSPLPRKKLAAQYNVGEYTIRDIREGRTWSTLDD